MLFEGNPAVIVNADKWDAATSVVGKQPSILVVEANPRALRAIAAALSRSGMRVTTATTISAAEEACHQQPFDLIILGWIVERLFADELLDYLRSRMMPQSMPPVAVLSCLTEKMTRACLRPDMPIQGILTTPLDPKEVANWADALLRKGA